MSTAMMTYHSNFKEVSRANDAGMRNLIVWLLYLVLIWTTTIDSGICPLRDFCGGGGSKCDGSF